MGSSSSKFRKHLQNGDEVAALNVYSNHSDLRKGLDPNCSYGDNFQHETPLHFAARHGMKSLLRIFLFEHRGNPNKTNGKKETALHCVCMEKNPQFYPVQRRRLECLNMMLQWRGAELKDRDIERVDLAAIDEQKNTALHYAAMSGLKACVEILVNHSCPLFMENIENQTPCDCAESSCYNDIALYLESKMVFSNDGTTDEIEEQPPHIDSEEYSGLRAQDLQEAKDQLLVETADMLSIPLFTAEALLRNHEWSREMLLDAWMSDPVACCEKSGVTSPANLFSEKPIVAESLSTPTMSQPPCPFAECEICTQPYQMNEAPVNMNCHQFCRECWEGYLNVKIQEGGVHDITCPGYDCTILVPVEVIENVVSRDMARRYLQFDIKAFVDSNPNIKWCPFPGCGRAVRLPEVVEGGGASGVTSPRHSRIPSDTSRAVDCGTGHYFCWECVGEAHEPCSCESLQKWMGEINEIKPEKLNGTEQDTETAANCLWLVTNSKSCPNCKSPIQKNEGCNHMKCSKCKYDFCWVCLDQWKRHNSSTGGYFKCNRYEVSKKVDDTTKNALVQAEEKNSKMQELNKFVHYYSRYKNHENSFKLEEPLLKTAKEKMLKLAEAVTDIATAKDETKFVEEAIHKLLKARRVLKYSYVYGYYLDGPPYRKIVFEFMQTELEECTEILSQMVNRLYLRTPRKKIIEQSQICHRKRLEFLTAISKGLVPPETPPGLRKKRRKYSMDSEDEDLRKAILASIEDFDPENPWIVNAAGRHTNVAALLDWPSDDSDDDDDDDDDINANVPSNLTTASTSTDLSSDICIRAGCSKTRAKNPRTGETHNFCSLRCSRLHKIRQDEPPPKFTDIQLDEQMDFLRALEMSRIQYLKEQGVISDDSRSDLTSSGEVTENKVVTEDHSIYTPAERLDIEIKRLLELSSLDTQDIVEADRKLSGTSLPEPLSDDKQTQNQSVSRFGDNQSTVVSRVPNKSVEDLYHPDCTSCQGNQTLSPPTPSKHCHHRASSQGRLDLEGLQLDGLDLESLGACGGMEVNETQFTKTEEQENQSFVDDIRIEGPIMQKLLNMDKIEGSNSEPIISSGGSSFGVIKDLSVSNIMIDDEDKTKHFAKKDLSNLSKNKSKVVDRGNGRLFAANTPGEDEKVFTLISPESDFSESSSSEVWGYRPQLMSEPLSMQTPETDSSIDGCSYADLPNQNSYYRLDASTNESSPVIGETKLMNSIGPSSQSSANQLSITEMTENLLQMTLDMQGRLRMNTQTDLQHHDDESRPFNSQEIPDEQKMDNTHAASANIRPGEARDVLFSPVERENFELQSYMVNDNNGLDLESSEALADFDQTVVSMETADRENVESREGTVSTQCEKSADGKSTFV